MSNEKIFIAQSGDFKTLPLNMMMARALEDIGSLSGGQAAMTYAEPEYTPMSYKPTPDLLNSLGADADAAIRAIRAWSSHAFAFGYFVQFKEDTSGEKIHALNDHSETLSILCDSRLGLDSDAIGATFDSLFSFSNVQNEYRNDPEREAKWDYYAKRLETVYGRLCEHREKATRLTQRMIRQVELKAGKWASLPAIHDCIEEIATPDTFELFYSYSHKDNGLRDQLETHLSSLKRQGVITEWHDRRVSAGRDWEGQIDKHLNSAGVILLLISADFIASDYCNDVELKRAMERHEARNARVIPVILRACDWQGMSFGKLQFLPRDAEPVTSWNNLDEAFTNVSKGIRTAVAEWRKQDVNDS